MIPTKGPYQVPHEVPGFLQPVIVDASKLEITVRDLKPGDTLSAVRVGPDPVALTVHYHNRVDVPPPSPADEIAARRAEWWARWGRPR